MALTITTLGVVDDVPDSTTVLTVPGGGVPAGAVIFVAIFELGGGAGVGGSVTDTAGNPYTLIQNQTLNNVPTGGFCTSFYAKNVTALNSGDVITYTKSFGAGAQGTLSAAYITGADPLVPLDAGATRKVGGVGLSPSVTSGTPSGPGNMFVAFVGNRDLDTGPTQDGAHGWAAPPDVYVGVSGAGGDGGSLIGGSQLNAGTGTLIYAPTNSVNDAWAALVCAFQPPQTPRLGRTTPRIFRPQSGPTRGLTPTLAYPVLPTSSDDVTPPLGRTPPRIFRPKAGPTRGLTPTWAYPPAIITPPVGRTPPRVFRPRAGPSRGMTPTWAFPPPDVVTPPQTDEPPYSHPGRDPFLAILAWQPGAPMPVLPEQLSAGVPGQSGDNPPTAEQADSANAILTAWWRPPLLMPVLPTQNSPGVPGQSVDDPPYSFSEREALTDSQIVDAWAVRWYGWEDRGQPLDARKNSPAIPGQSVDQPPFAHSERRTLIDTITDAWQVRWYAWTDRTQLLEARKLSPGIPGQSVDNPPVVHDGRAVAQLAGISVAWIAPPPAPILPKQNAPGVPGSSIDNPPTRQQAGIADAILQTWRPPDPSPTQRGPVGPGIPGRSVDQPIPTNIAVFPAILVAWIPPPPAPVLPKQNSPAIPGQTVDQPVPRTSKEPPLWWETARLPILPLVPLTFTPQDNPPFDQRESPFFAILVAWRPAPPAPILPPPVPPPSGAVVVTQPFRFDAGLIALLFPRDPIIVQPRRTYPLGQPEDQPPPQRRLEVRWPAIDPAPILPRQLAPGIPGVSVDQPPPSSLARRVEVAVAWRPADPAPTLPRQLSPGIPGLSADDPPRLRREALRLDLPFVLPQSPARGVPTSAIFAPVGWPWLGAVLRAWVPVPSLPELGRRFVVQGARVDQPPPSTLRTALASILIAWLPPRPMPILPKKAAATGGNVSPMAAAARIIVSGYRARLFSSGLRVRLLAHPPRRVRRLGLAATLGRLRVLISRRRIRKSIFRR